MSSKVAIGRWEPRVYVCGCYLLRPFSNPAKPQAVTIPMFSTPEDAEEAGWRFAAENNAWVCPECVKENKDIFNNE